MKVAFLTAGLSEVRGGGILLCNYVKALLKYSNNDVRLFSLEQANVDDLKLKGIFDESLLHRVKFIQVPRKGDITEDKFFRTLRFFKSILSDIPNANDDLKYLFYLRRGRGKYMPTLDFFEELLERLANFDILHMGAWSTLYALAAARLRDCLPFKTIVHSIYHDAPKEFLKWETCIGVLSRINAVSTSTPWEHALFKSCGLSDVFFIGEGVDIDYIRSIQKGDVNESNFTVMFLGARGYQKGYYHAVIAVNKLCQSVGYGNVQMIVIGRKTAEPVPMNVTSQYLDAYRELKKHESIYEYTLVTEEEKIRCLVRSHIVLLPSIAETIPLAALEAWAVEKPSILCDIPSVRSVVKYEGNGAFLVKFGDIPQIYRKLKTFYENKDLLTSAGIKGYQILTEFGSFEKISERIVNAYRKLIFNKP